VYSNLLIYFLVSKVKHILGICLAGTWRAVGRRWGKKEGVNEDKCLYTIKDSRYSIEGIVGIQHIIIN